MTEQIRWQTQVELDVERAADDGRIPVVISTDTPIRRRGFGGESVNEVLSHAESAIDLSRAPLPVTVAHDHGQPPVGVLEDLHTDGRRLRGLIRFGSSARAKELAEDVRAKIVRWISVGADVLQWHEGEGTRTAVRWQPFEASIVGVPADTAAGFYRVREASQMDESKDTKTETKVEVTRPDPDRSSAYEAELKRDALNRGIEAERTRRNHLELLGKRYGLERAAAEYIERGRTVRDFEAAIPTLRSNSYGDDIDDLTSFSGKPKDIGLTNNEIREFSFQRVIRALMSPNDPKAQRAAAFELECSEAARGVLGRPDKGGFCVPTNEYFVRRDLPGGRRLAQMIQSGEHQAVTIPAEVMRNFADPVQRAALEVATATAAGNLVATNLLASSFIDILRNRSVALNANALNVTLLRDLNGDVAVPRKTASSGFAWEATEGANADEATITVDLVTLTPRMAGVHKDFTRKLMLQSSVDIEQMIRTDLADQAAVGMDLAVLAGSGAAGQPTGIENTAGVGTVTFATAATPTWAETVELEADIETANALMGSLAYVTTPTIKANMKTTSKDTGSGQFLWNGGISGEVNGYPAYSTNQVTAGNVIFGNWADTLVGMWGGVDITVDPYSLSLSGGVRVVLWIAIDVAVRHAESYSIGA